MDVFAKVELSHATVFISVTTVPPAWWFAFFGDESPSSSRRARRAEVLHCGFTRGRRAALSRPRGGMANWQRCMDVFVSRRRGTDGSGYSNPDGGWRERLDASRRVPGRQSCCDSRRTADGPPQTMDRKTGRKTQANLPPCPLQRVGSEDTPPASAFGLAADALDGDVAGRALGGAVVARGAAAQGPAADRAAPEWESGGRFCGAPDPLALEALS